MVDTATADNTQDTTESTSPLAGTPIAPTPVTAPDPRLPADLRQHVGSQSGAVHAPPGQPASGDYTPPGTVPVAPTSAPAAVDAVTQGYLDADSTNTKTGMPAPPRVRLLDRSQFPTGPTDVPATPAEFKKPIDDLTNIGKAAGYLNQDGSVNDTTGQLNAQDQAALRAWSERRDQLTAEFEKRKSGLQWGEMSEIMGHALARLGAGLYGMHTGYDLSGMKFDSTDWSHRYDQSFQEYRVQLDDAEKQQTERAKVIQNLRGEYDKWRGGLESAVQAKAKAEMERQGQKAASQDRYREFLLNADKFDAEQTNKVAEDTYNWEVRDTIAQLRQANKIRPEDQELLKVTAADYLADKKQWMLKKMNHDQAITAISDLKQIDKAKDKDAARTRAYEALGKGGIDPAVWSDVQAAAKKRTSILPFMGDNYDDAVIDELKKRGASVMPPEPTFSDYIQRAGIGRSPTPGGGGVTTATTPATTKMRNKKTGQTGDMPTANVKAAIATGDYEQVQ